MKKILSVIHNISPFNTFYICRILDYLRKGVLIYSGAFIFNINVLGHIPEYNHIADIGSGIFFIKGVFIGTSSQIFSRKPGKDINNVHNTINHLV